VADRRQLVRDGGVAALEQGRALVTRIGNQSNLILDPDLDSYYMMDTVLLKLPEAQTQLARLRRLSDRVISQGSAGPEDRSELIILSGLLKKLGGRLRKTSEAVQTLLRAL